MEKKKSGFWNQLEEKIVVYPLILAVVFCLAGFVCNFFASEETVTLMKQISYYCYAYVACIGLSMCAHRKMHMRAALMDNVWPHKVRVVIDFLCELIGIGVMAVLLKGSFDLLSSSLLEGTMNSTAPALPLWIAYLAPVLGLAAAIVRTVIRLVKGEK